MKINIFLWIVSAILISSCTEEINTALETETNNSLFDLSENEALTIAESFQNSVNPSSKTRTGNTTFNIKSTYRLDTPEKTRAVSDEAFPLVYEIDMNDGQSNGRIIISGDKRFPEVLAYMPSFNDSLFQVSTGPNVMVQMAKNTLLNKIQHYETTSLTRSHPVESIPGEVSVMIVPFCTTTWHQNSPYNQLLPSAWIQYTEGVGNRPGSSWYANYNTGQAVVAIAQALAYLQPYLNIDGTVINWDALTTEKNVTPPYKSMAAILCKYIYNIIGTYPVWGKSYNDTWPQSSATIVDSVIAMDTSIKKIPDAINSSQCGLTCDPSQNWDLNEVKKSLLSLNPVFVGDYTRLAFLIDGYAINETNTTYFHCNFGNDGTYDGYFLLQDDGKVVFELNGMTFRAEQLGILTNMRNR